MGLRASGKSTLGAKLAERLDRPFIDLDEVTPRIMGFASLRDAWNALGERAFRNAELEALLEALANQTPHVIALGGGTPTAAGAAEMLREARDKGSSIIIYLRGEPETLQARLKQSDNTDRPSLTGGDVLAEVRDVFEQRDPLYRELASETLRVEDGSVERHLAWLAQLAESLRDTEASWEAPFKGVTRLSTEQAREIMSRVADRYCDTTSRTQWLWDRLRSSTSIRDDNGWKRIAAMLDDRRLCVIADSGPALQGFEVDTADLTEFLDEGSWSELIVTDDSLTFAIFFNHHDFLIGTGDAEAWVRSLGGA